MINKLYSQFGSIVGNVIDEKPIPENEYDLKMLYKLFSKHSMIPILNKAFNPSGKKPEDEILYDIHRKSMKRLAINVNQQVEINTIREAFEKAGIENLFIKGTVTRDRYPDPTFRTMGDIDFLYNPSQHSLVKNTLFDLGYSDYKEGRKNDTYKKPPYIVLEAHRQLVPSDSCFFDWCQQVWERALLKENYKYSYEMSLEDEIIFNIIHMAIHFLEGGAGARFLTDVYVYYNKCSYNKQYVETELKKLDLLDFYFEMVGTANFWFNNGEYKESYDKIIDFIIKGGTFGTSDTAKALSTEKGRLHYLINMFFPSYNEMCSLYPWLKGKAILLPFAWIKRGLNTLLHKRNTIRKSINMVKSTDISKTNTIRNFYKECGLNVTLRNK